MSPTDSPKSTRINASARTQAPQIGYITIPLHANTSELEELLLPVLQKINLLSLWFQMPDFLKAIWQGG